MSDKKKATKRKSPSTRTRGPSVKTPVVKPPARMSAAERKRNEDAYSQDSKQQSREDQKGRKLSDYLDRARTEYKKDRKRDQKDVGWANRRLRKPAETEEGARVNRAKGRHYSSDKRSREMADEARKSIAERAKRKRK